MPEQINIMREKLKKDQLKKIGLMSLFLMFVLVIPFSKAVIDLDQDLVWYLDFDTDATENITGAAATVNGATYTTTGCLKDERK